MYSMIKAITLIEIVNFSVVKCTKESMLQFV